ncbi:hypothetical protein VitviT2T_005561 [Vitis vinifera]|uniref:Uncharacterized protein n=1 Tax=Vitis vinifera TaxID=29760 RepID=A0ABY9BU89_VITVI|nr:hypothetical protein VitviT2T_005561 [Vitis vinifera]
MLKSPVLRLLILLLISRQTTWMMEILLGINVVAHDASAEEESMLAILKEKRKELLVLRGLLVLEVIL